MNKKYVCKLKALKKTGKMKYRVPKEKKKGGQLPYLCSYISQPSTWQVPNFFLVKTRMLENGSYCNNILL